MSTYYPNIPQSTDNPSVSQGQILTNFGTLNTVFAIDHVPFSPTAANQGEHLQITFSGNNVPSTPVDPVSIAYTNNVNSHPALFHVNSVNGAQYNSATTGSTMLLGGITIKWGVVNLVGHSAAATFVSPFLNNLYSVVCNALTTTPISNGAIGIGNLSVSGFTAYQLTTGALTVYYIAIGN